MHASYNRLFFLYLIDGPQGVGVVMHQLKGFPNDFVGSVWLAKRKKDSRAPQAVFMDNEAWKILEASPVEWKKRN